MMEKDTTGKEVTYMDVQLNEDGTVEVSPEEEQELEQDWQDMYTDLADYII